ncbi:unnamed protein product [Pleuronectes platessa]|uniref:Uncharacterized protein n=1 Tax=Pleuronectes platessa TaxID=8262 RepID=A0A9N7Z247_PLEPL|nr:unnamed protein product [Pleuronectes platessa]
MTLTGPTDSSTAGPRNNATHPGSHSQHSIETHSFYNNAVKVSSGDRSNYDRSEGGGQLMEQRVTKSKTAPVNNAVLKVADRRELGVDQVDEHPPPTHPPVHHADPPRRHANVSLPQPHHVQS